ncbi:Putative Zn-dependent oxidoreductase [Labilithrix luteola]|uniref:Putative Zn-dependent oxidoreductase n=2 Tax=Labilithrix luteola TaxID=1391654 RepID=A0A0K1Q5C2_9BACT|nr:Putative Zn-dependent oxidoreductase [Labilithrix luteola]
MKAIVFDRIGDPRDVLRLAEVPKPVRSPGHILVKTSWASINPGDGLFVQNLYPEPKKPKFPAQIAGNHGAGVVVEAAEGGTLLPGTRVAFSYVDVWAEYISMPEAWAIPVPDDYPLEKSAQMVNLVTARDLLDMSGAAPGEWIAVTAGNSTVSTMLAQMARAKDIHVLSIVRRRLALPSGESAALGASAVVELSSLDVPLGERIAEITKGKGLRAAIDGVGGPMAGDLIRSLSFGGKFIVYGGFSQERFSLHNFDILMNGVRIEPYLYRYFFEPPKAEDRAWLEDIVRTTKPEAFRVRSAGAHAADDFASAVRESFERPEAGKRFVAFGE